MIIKPATLTRIFRATDYQEDMPRPWSVTIWCRDRWLYNEAHTFKGLVYRSFCAFLKYKHFRCAITDEKS